MRRTWTRRWTIGGGGYKKEEDDNDKRRGAATARAGANRAVDGHELQYCKMIQSAQKTCGNTAGGDDARGLSYRKELLLPTRPLFMTSAMSAGGPSSQNDGEELCARMEVGRGQVSGGADGLSTAQRSCSRRSENRALGVVTRRIRGSS